jgi:outer membrane protein TolC
VVGGPQGRCWAQRPKNLLHSHSKSSALNLHLFSIIMLNHRLIFLRVLMRAMGVVLFVLGSIRAGAQTDGIGGSMPEDYLPSLKPILETALQRSPQLIAAELERMLAEFRIEGAMAARLPNLGGNLSYATNQTAVSSNTSSQTKDNGLFYSLSVRQALFHWRALQNQSDSARINAFIARRSYDLARRELGVLLRRAFLALVVEKSRLRAMAESLRLMRSEFEVTKEKKERGTVSPAALEGDRLRLREVQLEFDRAASEYEGNRGRFARLAGLKAAEFPEAAVPAEIPSPKFSPDLATALSASVLRDGAKSTLEYEINNLRVRDSLLRLSMEKVRLYPKFYASAGLSLENSTNVNGNTVSQQGIQRRTLSVFGEWTIFDGFATRGVIREALATRRAQERRLESETEALLQNIQNLDRTIRLDAEHLALAEIRQGMAVEGQKVLAREFEFGNASKVELDRAQSQILGAAARCQESRAAFLGRWSEFVALAGADPLSNLSPARHVREKK